MFFSLGTPLFVSELRKDGKMRSPLLEFFIFILLSMIGQAVGGVLAVPYVLVSLLSDERFFAAYSEAMNTMDVSAVYTYIDEKTLELMASPWYIFFMLLSTLGTIAAVLVYARKIDKRSYASLGLTRRGLLPYLGGFVLGLVAALVAVLFSAAFGALWLEGLSPDFNAPIALLLLLGFVVQGFSEELLCRGLLMTSLSRGLKLWMAVLVSALAFASLHSGNPSLGVIGYINLFLFGVLLALYMIRRGSIWGAAALHTAWNFAEGVLFGSPVSGMNMGVSLLRLGLREGDGFIHGGAFGAEGGIAVTFVLALGIAILLMMRTKDNQSAKAP